MLLQVAFARATKDFLESVRAEREKVKFTKASLLDLMTKPARQLVQGVNPLAFDVDPLKQVTESNRAHRYYLSKQVQKTFCF